MTGGPTGVIYVGAATIGTTEKGARGPRVPVAVGVSLAIHALGLVGFMRLSFKPAEENLQVLHPGSRDSREPERAVDPGDGFLGSGAQSRRLGAEIAKTGGGGGRNAHGGAILAYDSDGFRGGAGYSFLNIFLL